MVAGLVREPETPVKSDRNSGDARAASFCARRRSMSLEARIRELSERHKRLDVALAAELKHPAGDETRLQDLKRKKLRLKDEIAQLRSSP
jgi:hypothetical protein